MVLPVEELWHQLLHELTVETPAFSDDDVKDELSAVSVLLKNETVSKILEKWTTFLTKVKNNEVEFIEESLKSEEKAFEYRTLGNNAVANRDYHSAVHLYNKSLMFATRYSENYQFGLSNRAMALYKIGYVDGAMKDLRMAIASEFPIEKCYKLFYRLAQCYYSIGDAIEGTLNSRMSLYELVANSNLPNRNIKAMRRKIEKMMETLIVLKKPKVETVEAESFMLDNGIEQGMSHDLEIKKVEGKGRCVVVKSYVKRDDILFKEGAFVCLPVETGEVHSCDYCCSAIKQQVTCQYCAMSHYCNETCRVIAERCYHKYECTGLKIGLWQFTGIARLAFRVFLTGSQSGFSLRDIGIITNAKEMVHELDRYLVRPEYCRIYKLVTNMDKMEKVDLKTYALVSILLTYYMRSVCDYAQLLLPDVGLAIPDNELNLFISAMLLKHICQMICNSTVITRMADPLSQTGNKLSDEPVASAIYPSVSMMNHSCVPNTKISYEEKYIVVHALQNMKRGTEVFNCYGLQAGVQSVEERQTVLKLQYGFDCKCDACLKLI